MANITLRSRILEYFSEDCMNEIYKITKSNRINNVNTKADMIMETVAKYNIDFEELGTGTNRTAIFIDGYVFKIALDRLGIRDNDQEFNLSHELQPHVIKVYENNGLISVSEYVTVMSRDQFMENKYLIKRKLEDMSYEYLLGDIGTIEKNFANWGTRDDGEIVALDFAYIYRIIGTELECPKCLTVDKRVLVKYTYNYDMLECPVCKQRYTFMEIRSKISKEMEDKETELSKAQAYKITKAVEAIITDTKEEEDEHKAYTVNFNLRDGIIYDREKSKELEESEEIDMGKRNRKFGHSDINENDEDLMLRELSLIMGGGVEPKTKPRFEEDEQVDDIMGRYEQSKADVEEYIENVKCVQLKTEVRDGYIENSTEDIYMRELAAIMGNTSVANTSNHKKDNKHKQSNKKHNGNNKYDKHNKHTNTKSYTKPVKEEVVEVVEDTYDVNLTEVIIEAVKELAQSCPVIPKINKVEETIEPVIEETIEPVIEETIEPVIEEVVEVEPELEEDIEYVEAELNISIGSTEDDIEEDEEETVEAEYSEEEVVITAEDLQEAQAKREEAMDQQRVQDLLSRFTSRQYHGEEEKPEFYDPEDNETSTNVELEIDDDELYEDEDSGYYV